MEEAGFCGRGMMGVVANLGRGGGGGGGGGWYHEGWWRGAESIKETVAQGTRGKENSRTSNVQWKHWVQVVDCMNNRSSGKAEKLYSHSNIGSEMYFFMRYLLIKQVGCST